jgi:hypothetical protein
MEQRPLNPAAMAGSLQRSSQAFANAAAELNDLATEVGHIPQAPAFQAHEIRELLIDMDRRMRAGFLEMDRRFLGLETRIDRRFLGLETRMEARYDAIFI